ncbi:sigma factor-like helix-turn-helix DNA-binding protein [Streptomyces sp. NPDC001093]|uniref:sigma factor-like helix-turn-helix DNA-binding protein n=1 Tax=Streptomyces sp. NPDC001093 TaxID=3154376 RepID=UPI0033237290
MGRSNEARDMEMCKMYAAGRTLQEIGDQYGVTRERARQIISRRSDAVSASTARNARREARAEELTSQVGEFLAAHQVGIVKLAEEGVSRSDVEARFALLYPEVPAAVVREAIAEAKVLFDVDVQEFAFSLTAIEGAVWYALARERGLGADRLGAAQKMDLDELEGTGQVLLREGVESDAVAEILGLIHAAQELVRSGAQVGISAARYNARRESILEELGMESSKGTRPWPPTSQTVMKRLGEGSWAKAQIALGLTPDSRGRPEGLLLFEPQDYPAAVADFLRDAQSVGSPSTFEAYTSWVEAEERSGRRRPSAPSVRLYYRGWTSAKRAAVAEGATVVAHRTRERSGVPQAATALHHAQQETDRALGALVELRPADRSAHLERFLKAFMQEFEFRRRGWIRGAVALDGSTIGRRLSDPTLKTKHRTALTQSPPAVDEVLTDMYLDKLGAGDPRVTDGWMRPDVQAELDAVGDGTIARFTVLKESRNYLVHGSQEARRRLEVALKELATVESGFELKQSLTPRVLLTWLLANDQRRLRVLLGCVPDLWRAMVIGETLLVAAPQT